MAKMGSSFGAGNITGRNAASSAVKKENRAIKNRPSGWTISEARRAHRNSNARSIRAMRRAA